MLAYKVVEQKTRYSSNAALWLRKWSKYDEFMRYKYKELETILDYYNARNYILKYDIGAELYAIPGSPGIMCFMTKENAIQFIDETLLYNTIIIEVEGKDIIHNDSKSISLLNKPGDISSLNSDHIPEDYGLFHYEGMISFNKVIGGIQC